MAPAMNYLRLLVRLRRHPSAVLLATQLLALVLYPFIEDTDVGRICFGIFGILVLIATLRIVHRTPFTTWIGAGIAVPAIVLLVLQMTSTQPHFAAWSAGLESLFYFYAAGSLIAYMLADRHATTDELFAAAATFTLLAWAFAYLFLMVQAVQPGSFTGARLPEEARNWTELMFLSFALLSSTGMGDVLPMSGPARGAASIEMFVGVMYLAAVVSRLIGLTLQGLPMDRR
jgi:hypothetical protein